MNESAKPDRPRGESDAAIPTPSPLSPPVDLAARRVALVVFLTTSLCLMGIGYWLYRSEAGAIRDEKYRNLAAFCELKANEIQHWRKTSLAEAGRAVKDSGLNQAIRNFLGAPADPRLQAELRENLTLAMVGETHANVLLFDANLNQLIASKDDRKLMPPAVMRNLQAALTNQAPVLSDFFPYSSNGVAQIDVAVAVRDRAGQPLAVMVVRHHAGEELIPMVRFWPGASPSTEAALVQREEDRVVLLNGLIHGTNVTMNQWFPLTRTELPSVQVALGRQGRFETINFLGVKVVTDLCPIPGKSWGLFAKVNEAEIRAEARQRLVFIGSVISALILLLGMWAIYYYRRRQTGVLLKLYEAEQRKVEAQATYRATLYSIGDGVITTDSAGRVRELNGVAEKLTGWTEAEARGKPLEEIFRIISETDRTPVATPVQIALRDQQVVGLANHTLLIARDGTERSIADSAAPIRGADGGISGVVLVFSDQTRQRTAQRELYESEERYRRLFERASVGIVRLSADGKILSVNDAYARALGYRPEEMLGMNPMDLDTPASAQLFPERHRRILAGEVLTFETENYHKDGHIVPIEVSSSVISVGGESCFQSFVRDITERKRAEAELQRMNRSLRLISLFNQEMVRAKNEAALLPAACQLAVECGGYRLAWIGLAEQDEARTVRPVAAAGFDNGYLQTLDVSWDDVERGCGPVGTAIRTGQPVVVRDIRTNPQFEPWRRSALERGYGSVIALPLKDAGSCLGSLNLYAAEVEAFDAEEVKLLEELAGDLAYGMASLRHRAERQQAEKMRILQTTALNATANPMLITDRKGRIEWVNPAFTRLTGYSSEESVGKNPRELLGSGMQDDAFYQKMWNTILSGRVWRDTLVNRRKDGILYTEEETITPVLDAQGEIAHFIAVKEDISKRIMMEEQFRQAQKMQAVGVLAGGVAHDFNNLLGIIMGNVSLAEQVGASAGEKQRALQEITRASERAANLTRQLLAFGRKSMMQIQTFDLNEAVPNMVKMLQRIIGEDITLQTSLLPGAAMVQADPGMIDQVLLNLAVNARDAMPQGGQLNISLQNITLDEAAAERHPGIKPGAFIRLSVRDTGTGIAPEVLPLIFEPFFTTKEVGKGSGLGLSTVYGILEQHRGWVEVESELGRGTVFHVYLPCQTVEPKSADGGRMVSFANGGRETILLVEDELSLRETLAQALKHYGYTVIEAASGTAALASWPQHRAVVDLLLTDIVMPDGLSGWELVRQLQADKPDLKVVCMSGYPGEVAEPDQGLRQVFSFLEKPFSPAKLVQIIRDCLDAKIK